MFKSLWPQVHETVTSNKCVSPPSVVLLLIGRHPAALQYAECTKSAAEDSGVKLRVQCLTDLVTDTAVLKVLRELNADSTVHGVCLQLPLPSHLDEASLIDAVADMKDMDGLKQRNVIRFTRNSADKKFGHA